MVSLLTRVGQLERDTDQSTNCFGLGYDAFLLWVARAAHAAGMGQLGNHFGQEVRALRQERGLSQAQLAEAAGTSEEWIRRIERGARSPSFDTVEAIAAALGVTAARLFVGYGDTADVRTERLLAEVVGLDEAQLRWLEEAARLLCKMPR